MNSQWFSGWSTRPPPGWANSCLASREITRLSSSSPVAATTTSTADMTGRDQGIDLAGVGHHPGDVQNPAHLLDQVGILLDDEDVVAAGPRSVAMAVPTCRPRRWRPSRPGSRWHPVSGPTEGFAAGVGAGGGRRRSGQPGVNLLTATAVIMR